ncbi:glycosyltransferase [Niabella sp.]|uniref:glycosyltransferase family 2 protein n=1 Tax=Niabella sp. TaxID=1962976 RepID=UPI00261D0199|nr:glycosyltransferase [Niabella sp.]
MPVHNGARYLKECLDSLMNQGDRFFELIIIDDRSTDDSVAIARAYQDERIRILQDHSIKGISQALNLGIQAARGIYIARMDADDICHKDRLQLQRAYLDKYPEVDVVGTQFQCFGAASNRSVEPEGHEQICIRLLNGPPLCHPTLMMRRQLFERFAYDAAYDDAEDYKLLVDFATNEIRFALIDKILLYKRIHEGQVSVERRLSQYAIMYKVRRAYFNYRFPYLNEKQIDQICANKNDTTGFRIAGFNAVLRVVEKQERIYKNRHLNYLLYKLYSYTIYVVNPEFTPGEYLEMMRSPYPYKYLRLSDILRLLKRVFIKRKTYIDE